MSAKHDKPSSNRKHADSNQQAGRDGPVAEDQAQAAELREETSLAEQLKQLQERCNALQAERDELFARLQRVSADFQNFRNRVPERVSQAASLAKEDFVRAVLDVMDDLEHALKVDVNHPEARAVLEGVQMVHRKMLQMLKAHGVEPIDSLGKPFDPTLHEAMMQTFTDEHPDHTVVVEHRRGYRMGDRTIRPARVTVSRLPADSSGTEGQPAAPPDGGKRRQQTQTEETAEQ